MTSLAIGAAIWTTSCASDPLRAVVDVVPTDISYSFEVTVGQDGPPLTVLDVARAGDETSEGLQPMDVHELCSLDNLEDGTVPLHLCSATIDVLGILGDANANGQQLDPELGPLDLGYPLLVDLGAGEAPYDDGIPTIHGVELTRGGFSDALLQASWREPVTRSSMLHTTVAVSRFQDIGMLDGLSDMRFAWLVFGWKTSF